MHLSEHVFLAAVEDAFTYDFDSADLAFLKAIFNHIVSQVDGKLQLLRGVALQQGAALENIAWLKSHADGKVASDRADYL